MIRVRLTNSMAMVLCSMLMILITHQSTIPLNWTLASAQLPAGSGTTCAAYIWHNDVLYFYGGMEGDSPTSDPYSWVENGYKWDPVNDISTFTAFPQPPPTTLQTCSWGSPKAAVIDEIMYIYNDNAPELVQFNLTRFDWISGTISVQDADIGGNGFIGCMVSDGTYLYVIGAHLAGYIRRYHPATNSWISSKDGGMSAYLPGLYSGMQCTYYNNKIYQFGGYKSGIGMQSTIYIYDIATDAWSLSTESLIEGVNYTPDIVDHTRQRAYIIGGGTTGGYDNQYKVQIYDIPNNTVSWDNSSDLPVSLAQSIGGFVENTIYLLGGVSYRTATNGIYYATIKVPTNAPTRAPTLPTDVPSSSPTRTPTNLPTSSSAAPSRIPTNVPTASPTRTPTDGPTVSPSRTPTDVPTGSPSRTPTVSPSRTPTTVPTAASAVPTVSPTLPPTDVPTTSSSSPSLAPTDVPTPASAPPSRTPSGVPTPLPSGTPTGVPTTLPSRTPTDLPTASPSPAPTDVPTPSPSRTPTEKYIAGESTEFQGYELFVRGYNIWKMSTAGHALLDINWAEANIESWTKEGAVCSLSSLEFGSSFSSYAEYAESSSESIEAGYSAGAGRAGGSMSTERTETKSYSESAQSYIYSLDLECTNLVASLNTLNKLHWSSNFINNLRVLPDSFDSSDITPWTDFWDSFGTHVMKSAKLGGRVTGAITVDKCTVEEAYSDSDSYQACLNAAYTGAEAAGCYEESSGSSSVQSAQNAIQNTRIVVKGGSTSQFTDVFNSFSDKTDNFQSWIDGLGDHPDIIGGNLDEIHDVIVSVTNLGNHNFNLQSDFDLEDDEWIAKANALEEAYIYYSATLVDEDIISESCRLDCDEGTLDTVGCKCDGCSEGGKCCGIQVGYGVQSYVWTPVSRSVVFALACFAILTSI